MTGAGSRSPSVPFETIARSAHGGPLQPAQAVISSEEALQQFFGGDPPPHGEIDFGQSTVLAVALGTRGDSDHAVEITDVRRAAEGAWVVRFAETRPRSGSFVSHIVTTPFHVVRCSERLDGPVVFSQD